jgi:hypothetical protein
MPELNVCTSGEDIIIPIGKGSLAGDIHSQLAVLHPPWCAWSKTEYTGTSPGMPYVCRELRLKKPICQANHVHD